MIKNILIDIDDTLLDFNKCAEESMRDAMSKVGIEYRDGMMNVFHRVNDSLWKQVEQGTLTVSQLYEIRWDAVFAEMGVCYDGKAFEQLFLYNIHRSAVPVDGAVDILSYLSNKYKLYAASNAPYEQQRERLQKAGMLSFFVELFTSESLGVSKPHKEFFELCLDRMRATAEQTAIIGDSLNSDIKGGIESGLFTCWFNFKNAEIPSNMKINATVKSLAELKIIL